MKKKKRIKLLVAECKKLQAIISDLQDQLDPTRPAMRAMEQQMSADLYGQSVVVGLREWIKTKD